MKNKGSPAGIGSSVDRLGGAQLSSVDATDIEFIDPKISDPIGGLSVIGPKKPKHTTTWTTLGKFTINYPTKAKKGRLKAPDYDVTSILFEYANQDPITRNERPKSSFTVTPPIDNVLSDFTLPGSDPNATTPPPEGDTRFLTTMTMHFREPIPELVTLTNNGTQCVVAFTVTSGKSQGDQGGKAKLTNAPISSDRPQDNCWLELGSSFTFVNGGAFQWPKIPSLNP